MDGRVEDDGIIDVAGELGAAVGEQVYSAGGGSRNDAWLQIRADTLGRTVLRPALTGGAMGAAITGAVLAAFGSLSRAARAMVRIDREVAPRPEFVPAYRDKYARFKDECVRRGYVTACAGRRGGRAALTCRRGTAILQARSAAETMDRDRHIRAGPARPPV